MADYQRVTGRTRECCPGVSHGDNGGRKWLHRPRLVFQDAAGEAVVDVVCPLPWDLKNSTATQVALEKRAARLPDGVQT